MSSPTARRIRPCPWWTPSPDWHGDTDGWYYPIAFYEPGRDIPAMRYVSYIRLENGSMNFTFGTDYPKG